MKTNSIVLATLGVALLFLTSCLGKNNPDYSNYYTGIVTVKTNPTTKAVYLQLNEKTTLLPTNLKEHPSKGKEVRALVNYKDDKKAPHEGYTKAVHVLGLKEILTKNMVPSKEDNDAAYGKDPIGLGKEQCLIEDGYLTIIFAARYGDSKKPHEINLVSGVDPKDPYTLELRHNAKGDTNARTIARAYAAFSLKDLPDTKGEKKSLKIRFVTETGSQTINLDYVSGKKADPKAALPANRSIGDIVVE